MLDFDSDYFAIESAIRASLNIELIADYAYTAFKDIEPPEKWTKYPLLSSDAAILLSRLFNLQVTKTDRLDSLGIMANSSGGEVFYKRHDTNFLAIRIEWP